MGLANLALIKWSLFLSRCIFRVVFVMSGVESIVLEALSEKSIAAFIHGDQSQRKGQSIVSCSEVYALKHNLEANRTCSFSAIVRAEMKASEAYKVTCVLKEHEILNATCTCVASTYSHIKCKHVAALLYTIFIVHTPNLDEPKWISKRRRIVKRYANPGDQIWQHIRGDLNFEIIKKEALGDVERHGGRPLKIWDKPKEKKGKKKPTYCLCNGENKGERMVRCDQCQRWYHMDCLEKVGKAPDVKEGFVCTLSVGCGKEESEKKEDEGGAKEEKKRKEKAKKTKRAKRAMEVEKEPPTKRRKCMGKPGLKDSSERKKEKGREENIYAKTYTPRERK